MRVSRWLALAALLPLASCYDAEACPSPLEACNGVCYDLSSEPRHCGRCSNSCGTGLTCFNGTCTTDPEAACRDRVGGAWVSLLACGQVVKVWAVDEAFIARAQALAADPLSPGPTVPVQRLVTGSDCDDQWGWHTSVYAQAFEEEAASSCDACPGEVEEDLTRYVQAVGEWCPSGARIVAVDERPAASGSRTAGE